MRVRFVVVLLLALAILVSTPTLALARSQDPANPEVLVPDQPRTGILPGAAAGSFAFFAVDYPGGEQELVIRMTPRPADPSVANQIAFNVYGPDGLIGTSGVALEGDPSVREFRYTDSQPVRLLVQLFNYTMTTTITYSMVATGISAAQATPTVTPATPHAATPPSPAPPDTLPEAGPPTTGTLVGSLGGAFATFSLPYAGDGSSVTVEAVVSPDDPVLANAVGINIYAPDGHLVAEGTTRATPGRRRATFASDVGGTYTIQLFNYSDGVPVTFDLSF